MERNKNELRPSTVWKLWPQSANWNILDINAERRVYENSFDIRTDRWQLTIRKTVYKMVSTNMRNREGEMVKHLNCHAKQSAMKVPDL